MLRLACISVVLVTLLSACGGDDALTAAQAPNEPASGRDRTTDPDAAQPNESRVDASSDAGVDANADADAGAGDQLAFDTFMAKDQGALVTADSVRIVLGAGGWFCGGTGLAGVSSIELNLATTAPGTYSITTGSEAVFQRFDPQCGSLSSHPVQSGSITITSVDASTVKGMFDVVFSGFARGRAVGAFVAPICKAKFGAHANCAP